MRRTLEAVRAVVCSQFGPTDGLAVAEHPAPEPGERELLVRVAAAGLNYPDALIVLGKYQVKPPLPFVPGIEVAGEVAAVGARVREFRVGDSVMATPTTGAFAELCAVPVERVLARPPSIAPDVAAGSLVTYGTTWHAFQDRARLEAGETVLVLGAAGGVGTAAIEIAKLMGARVIAAASTGAKLELCRQLGADATVDYSTENLRDRIRELTGGRGVDVIYDPVGGPYSEPALRSAGWGARHLVIGFASGEIPKIPLNLALLNSRSIVGVYWGDWAQRNREASAGNFARIADAIANGRLRPVISGRLRLEEIPRGLEDLLNRRVHGKLVAVL
jgi:NADPH:quinone reductase